MVTIKNRRNGAQSEMTKKEWEELQANPNYNGMFVEVKPKTVDEPEEVKQLNKRKAAKKPEAAEPAVTEQPEQTEQSETVNADNGK